METKVRVIYPNSTGLVIHTESFDLPEKPTWQELKPILAQYLGEDANPEHVTVFWGGQYTDMFVDEDGRSKGLEPNIDATKIYYNNMIVHDPAGFEKMVVADGGVVSPILGTAVLFDRKVWF
jgi:hypothetical protein